ncbi:MAG: hypothetical protein ABI981_14715 [Betaproteobacteria bacterium]
MNAIASKGPSANAGNSLDVLFCIFIGSSSGKRRRMGTVGLVSCNSYKPSIARPDLRAGSGVMGKWSIDPDAVRCVKNVARPVPDDSDAASRDTRCNSALRDRASIADVTRCNAVRALYVLAVIALPLVDGCTGVTPPAVVAPAQTAAPAARNAAPPPPSSTASAAHAPLASASPATSLEAQAPPAPANPAAPSSAPRVTPASKAAPPGSKTAAPSSPPSAPAPKKDSVAAEPVGQKPPPLDLSSLEQRLKQTSAIGILTKITLKNQVDDLLVQFRGFYAGKLITTLAELRRSYDLLVLKVLSLLQDGDAVLAQTIAGSREAIWSILSDPAKFAKI